MSVSPNSRSDGVCNHNSRVKNKMTLWLQKLVVVFGAFFLAVNTSWYIYTIHERMPFLRSFLWTRRMLLSLDDGSVFGILLFELLRVIGCNYAVIHLIFKSSGWHAESQNQISKQYKERLQWLSKHDPELQYLLKLQQASTTSHHQYQAYDARSDKVSTDLENSSVDLKIDDLKDSTDDSPSTSQPGRDLRTNTPPTIKASDKKESPDTLAWRAAAAEAFLARYTSDGGTRTLPHATEDAFPTRTKGNILQPVTEDSGTRSNLSAAHKAFVPPECFTTTLSKQIKSFEGADAAKTGTETNDQNVDTEKAADKERAKKTKESARKTANKNKKKQNKNNPNAKDGQKQGTTAPAAPSADTTSSDQASTITKPTPEITGSEQQQPSDKTRSKPTAAQSGRFAILDDDNDDDHGTQKKEAVRNQDTRMNRINDAAAAAAAATTKAPDEFSPLRRRNNKT